jgi:hypothetical protein
MVQVLDDLLADETEFFGKFLVWVRVGSELPMSIVQENINNKMGIKTMNTKILKKHRRAIELAAVFLLAVLLTLSLGWLRTHVLPPVTGVFYRHGLQTTFDAQNQAIGDPIRSLSGKESKKSYHCVFYSGASISTEIGCSYNMASYFKLGDATKKEETLAKVATIEKRLSSEGYKAGTNGVTLTSLVSETYEGKDYSPDAFYQKVTGKNHCVFDTYIAYSNPATPALGMSLECTRTVNILGKPSTSTYQASEGFGYPPAN